MALAATTVFEVRTTGSDLNGGGYNPSRSVSGVDRSQQDAAHVVIDGATISSVAGPTSGQNITLTGHTVADADLGNLVNIYGVCYEITAVNAGSNYWTLDRDTGASVDTVVTGRMGGALATPGFAASIATVAGSTVWLRAGTYTISSTTANVAGGRISLTTAGTVLAPNRWLGYTTTRGDYGTKPELLASVGSMTIFTVTGACTNVENIEIDGGGQSSVKPISHSGSGSRIYRCKFDRGSNRAVDVQGGQLVVQECEITRTTGAGAVALNQCVALNCYVYANSVNGVELYNQACAIGCIVSGNTGIGINASGAHAIIYGNTVYGNTGNGITVNVTQVATVINNISTGNGAYGIAASAVKLGSYVQGNATYNNTSGGIDATNLPSAAGNTTLSADPFVDAASGNLALNSTAGGGAACKAAGIPGAFPGGTTTGYLDIGAAQSQASGGASSARTFNGM